MSWTTTRGDTLLARACHYRRGPRLAKIVLSAWRRSVHPGRKRHRYSVSACNDSLEISRNNASSFVLYIVGECQGRDELFTTDRPEIFAFHGDPAIVHKLPCRRRNHHDIHVRGYTEEGTTTTASDMVVLSNLDRYPLALDAIKRIPRLEYRVEQATARYGTTMKRHKLHISRAF